MDKYIIAFLSGVKMERNVYKFDEELSIVNRRKDNFIKQYIESRIGGITSCLSRHDKDIIRSCKYCLKYSLNFSENNIPEDYFEETKHLFIYLIEALRTIKASNAVDYFIIELSKTEKGLYEVTNHDKKKLPCSKIGLKEQNYSDYDLHIAKDIFDKIYGLHKLKEKSRNRLVHSIILYNKALFTEDKEVAYLMLMQLLECLFAPRNDRGELRYSLSNRITWFLCKKHDTKCREKLFDKFQEIYGYRCKIIHGADVKPDFEKGVRDTIGDLREICRKSLDKIFHNNKMFDLFSGKKDLIDNYLQQLTLDLH